MKKIVVDIYGADKGEMVIIEGCRKALATNDKLFLVMVGDRKLIENSMSSEELERIEIIDTDKFVRGDAPPTCVFGGGDDYSMVMALTKLKNDDDCVGIVSAGNTGALMVGAICRLGLVPGLKCPALATVLPCKHSSHFCLVDCGANTECTPKDLQRFALMGDTFVKSYMNIKEPKIALMSVGREKSKGNSLIKDAYPLIEELPVNFIGNIEGNDFVDCEADVVVTDGFTGNVLLKNTEAAGLAALEIAKNALDEQNYKIIEEKIKEFFDFNSRGGAIFLGTKKTVVKMHGCADKKTVQSCIELAYKLHKSGLDNKISQALVSLKSI